jgi:hypothetical protein
MLRLDVPELLESSGCVGFLARCQVGVWLHGCAAGVRGAPARCGSGAAACYHAAALPASRGPPLQTYEGGLGGEPGNEAHGGYTFCGLAALALAGRAGALDLPRLARWAAARQSWAEGGFNGRTNKLADGCYSFWQGGVFALLHQLGLGSLRQMQVGWGRRRDGAGEGKGRGGTWRGLS